VAKKPVTHAERIEVIYNKKRWDTLKELRSKTIQIMEAFNKSNLYSIVHGSIARGDISEKSDIDVFLPDASSSFMIESTLENAGISVSRRVIVQATPLYAVKGYIEIDEQRCVSFPLLKLRPSERFFYKFGGEATLDTLRENARVPGVDKRLMFIEPTQEGHIESTVVGQEAKVARLLGISVDTVRERVYTLLRRDEVGRTGLFIEKELSPDETFEMTLKKLAEKNPAVRRRLRLYGK
jgi:predicted nucleotidyltransferase